jgi:tetratricopeptide (TPR) repeat protein
MKMNHLKNIAYNSSFLLLALFIGGKLSAQVEIYEKPWIIPTYMVQPPEKAPIFFTEESYQGASQFIYPYAMNDVISTQKVDKSWKTLMLENEYIKLCVTPEIGGKLYYATDKTNGYNFIYKNDVVKPVNIGMTGAWVSGGIEWCVLHHHRASTFLPMDYTFAENEDGSKTIYIGEIEPRHRMRWTVGITVFPGKSYFEAELSIYNPTPYTNTFLYWANVAAHTNENYQTIFPPSVQFATFHSKTDFTHWPYSTEKYKGEDYTKGVDISWWKNVKTSASFFAHDLQEDFMGGYDHGENSGTIHIGDHNIVKGAKLWEWGSGPRGQATEGRLTETSGPYVEIMVGAFSDNQPDYTWIRPYEVKRWKQYWYPVKDIEGFKNANLNAAVNLEQREGNKVFLGYHSTQKVNHARIILKNRESIILQKELQISPEKAFTEIVEIEGDYNFTELSTEMTDSETNEVLISYQQVEKKRVEKLPEVVDQPPHPEDIANVEELFLTGNRMEQFYKTSKSGTMEYYEEALKRDPGNIRTNIAIGNQSLKNGDYNKARSYFSTAAKRITHDYTRPSTCEVFYLQGLTLKALELYDEAIDTLYRATWDYAFHSAAYFELSQISCIKGDFEKALLQINESLSTNMKNNRAIGLKASIQRRLGDYVEATKTLANIPKTDPLNFRVGNEVYLIAKESGKKQEAEKELVSLTKKMRNFDQNYLELAVGYLNEGMLTEAENALIRYKGENPIAHYYLGYIQDKYGNRNQAEKLFKTAQGLSEDYCFPYRLETIKILKTALAYNENDGKAYYYLGNILYNKQPSIAMEYWENAVKNDPGLAMAYRNLGWGYYRHYNDYQKAIAYYEQAISHDKRDAILYTELDNLYELNNSPIEKRLKIFEGNNEFVKKRDDAFVRQLTVLTLAGKPDLATEYLKDKVFSYREGTSVVREVIIDAQLSLGMKYLANKNYQKAFDHFLLAQIPDEEAGSARFGNRDIQVNYYIGLAHELLKNKNEAEAFYKLATTIELSDISERGFMSYYQGLSYLKLNDKTKANEIFMSLVANGDKQLNTSFGDDSDFFAIFGEREDKNTRASMAYTIRGLGYKGLGKKNLATEDLQKAVELSVSNLWANTELNRQ